MAYFLYLAIFRGIQPGFCQFDVVELENDEPSRRPISFQRFRSAAACNIFAAIEFHGWRRTLLVFLVRIRIRYVDVYDHLGCHEGVPLHEME